MKRTEIEEDEVARKVDPAWLDRIRREGTVIEGSEGLLVYWGKRNISGLLLMPAMRHNFVPLKEADRIRNEIMER